MEEAKKILFSLLRAAVNENFEPDEKIKQSIPEHLQQLYSISKAHDIAHLVGYQLKNMGALPEGNEISAKFTKQQLMAIYRYERTAYEQERLFSLFEQERIPFLPLKGAVIRGYYPEPWMRTSCDIDILVDEDKIDGAVKTICESLSYKVNEKRNYHDIGLFSESGVHLELHFNIKEDMDNIDQLLLKVWEYAQNKSNDSYEYILSNEFLIFHIVAHMSYHFVCGGCGIRPFIDLWLLRNKLIYDEHKVYEMCKLCNIDKFYNSVVYLSKVWFEGEKEDQLAHKMEDYIIKGGIYGSMENGVAVKQGKEGGKFSYILSRLFMPYRNLKTLFPILEKHAYLTPFCQLCRWSKLLFRKSAAKKSVNELKLNGEISKEQLKSMASFLSDIGLK